MNGRARARECYERGHRLAMTGEFAAAMADFNQALELDAGFAEAYVGRGVCRHKLGQVQEAWQDIEQAAQLGNPAALAFLQERRPAARVAVPAGVQPPAEIENPAAQESFRGPEHADMPGSRGEVLESIRDLIEDINGPLEERAGRGSRTPQRGGSDGERQTG